MLSYEEAKKRCSRAMWNRELRGCRDEMRTEAALGCLEKLQNEGVVSEETADRLKFELSPPIEWDRPRNGYGNYRD